MHDLFSMLTRPWSYKKTSPRIRPESTLVDLSSRLKVSNPRTIFNGNLSLGKSTYLWDEVVGGTGTSTFVTAEVACDMRVAAAGDYVIRQTRERFNYQAGKPQEYWISSRIASGLGIEFKQGAFCSSYVAPYTANDGLYFKTYDGVAYCCSCKGGVETAVPQSQWNFDTLDGNGPSGMTLDLTKPQLMTIAYEWLGVGPARFAFMIDGTLIPIHIFTTANVGSAIYMRNCTQPVRIEIRSHGGVATARHQCAAVIQDGGEENFGIVGAADTDGNATSVAVGVTKLILAARINPLHPNHQVKMVSSYLFNSAANTALQWMVLWRPTFAGALTWVDIPDSCIQVAYGNVANTTLTGATLSMESGYTDNKSASAVTTGSQTTLSLGTKIDGTSDIIALCAKSIVGTCNIYGGLQARQYL